jgi:uncharacterized protein YjbJ (UPF0337 family)
MNVEIFKGNWTEAKGKLKQQWADLTDDELLKIEGKHDEIYGILEKRYGYAKDKVTKMLDDMHSS